MIGNIFITDLSVPFRIGMSEAERELARTIRFDITCTLDMERCCTTGDLKDTVDFKDINAKIMALADSRYFTLIETLADAVANTCLSDPKIRSVEVTLRKQQPHLQCAYVGIALSKQKTHED